MITPAEYGPVQISLDTVFADGRLWWDGAQWQTIPEDPKTAVKAFGKVVAASRSRDIASNVRVAGALYQVGNAELRRDREAQALRAYDELLTRFSGDMDRAIKGYVAAARVAEGNHFVRKASQTRAKDRPRVLQQGLAQYRAVIERYARDPDPGMHVWIAEAMADSAFVFGGDALNNKAMAIVFYDAVMRRLASHSGRIARRLTAFAGLNGGLQREKLGFRADAIAVTNQMLATLGDDPDPKVSGYLATARSNLVTWQATGPPAAAAAAPPATPVITPDAYGAVKISLDASANEGHFWWKGAQWIALPDDAKAAAKVLQRDIAALGHSPDASTNVALAGALYQLGNAQRRLGHETQTMRAYDDLLSRFSASPDPAIQGYVAAAMCGKAWFFGMKADRGKPSNRPYLLQQALAGYRAVIGRYANDPNPGLQVWAAKALAVSGQTFASDSINDKAMAIVSYDVAARLLSRHSGPLANQIKALAALKAGFHRAQLGLTSDAIATTQAMVATFGDDMDATILGYVAIARSSIATWQNAAVTAIAPKAEAPKRKSQASGVVAALVAVACIFVVALVASRGFSNISGSALGSQSADNLNLGGTSGSGSGAGSGGGSGGNSGAVVTAPPTAAPKCVQSNYGSQGGWSFHHMVDFTSTAPCWAHEIVDLASGCLFSVNGTIYSSSSAPVNIWNIDFWGYGSGGYLFHTASGRTLIYTCVQNAAVYPQTTPNGRDW